MDGDAFLFMILSWALILGLNLFCFTLLMTRSQGQAPESVNKRRTVSIDEKDEIT